ncbi:MAG TPA: thioredoxin domain-containing protein [Blastocatellia bacterium]|nr:thioredoxin domain-containing protein [Blastocatellia bacterium]
MGRNIDDATDQSFERDVLGPDGPVLVDFWGEQCAPCTRLEPIFVSMAERYEGRARFARVNVSEGSLTAQRYRIKGLPTLILFKDGSEVERLVGTSSSDAITAMIDSVLPHS